MTVHNPLDDAQILADIGDVQDDMTQLLEDVADAQTTATDTNNDIVSLTQHVADIQSDVLDILANQVVIEQEVYEIEHHLHSRERWFGISADQSGNDWGLQAGLNPYRAISGNSDFGSDANDEAKVLGTDDTPAIAGHAKFDPHRIMVDAASNANEFVIRAIYGAGTMADAETAGQYSDVMVTEARKGAPIEIKMPRCDAGVHQIWIRVKNATNNAWIDFYYGIHEYER